MTQNMMMMATLIPVEYVVVVFGSSCVPSAIQKISATSVGARDETSLSTSENSVPMIPGMYLPERYVS